MAHKALLYREVSFAISYKSSNFVIDGYFSDTANNFMANSIFIESLISASSRYSRSTAIVDNEGNRKTSFGQLFELAGKVSSYIKAQKIERQSFICIMMPHCAELIAAEIGVWMSRCAAVPMFSYFPQARKDYILKHCNSALLIDEALIEVIKGMPSDNITTIPDKDDNAVILYTSGSTGNPKGVLHTFRTLDAGVPRSLVPGYNMENMIYGNAVPLTFGASFFLYDVLIAGGTVHLYSDEVRLDAQKMADYIKDNNITASVITPAALTVFRNVSDSLKLVITAGERLTTQHSRDGYSLYNIYGQTETINYLTSYRVDDSPMTEVPLGHFVKEIEYRIVKEDGTDASTDEEGELCVRGNFCKEYYKEPELTAQLYRGGWLHTKDIVRIGGDGLLYYVNRKDWMVKVNGQRVEPGEVEKAMCRIDGISDAIVKDFDNKRGSRYLCGYYISETVDEETVKSELKKVLPSYMVPLYFMRMQSFPLNQNGKKDRMALQEPQRKIDEKRQICGPANETEKILCDAFCKVLELDEVDVNDDFFRIGGDSVNVMRVQEACPTLALTSKMIYGLKTPRQIAEAVSSQKAPTVIASDISSAPLTQAQLGIFTECEKRRGEAVYNNPLLFRFMGRIDVEKLRKAVYSSVLLHPALTAVIFVDENGVASMKKGEIPNMETLCPLEKMSEAELEVAKHTFQSPFDLYGDCLCRFRIIETEEAVYLFSDIHHIVIDGTSMQILFSDIDRALKGEEPVGESLSAFELATRESAERDSDAYAKAREWYLKTFGGLDAVSLPLGDKNLKETIFARQKKEIDISPDRLSSLCKKNNVTPNILALSAFGYLLSSYTQSHQCSFSTIYNGRTDISTGHTVSMMVRTLPVHCLIKSDITVSQFMENVKKQLTESMANDIYSFVELAASTGFGSDVLFSYQAGYHSAPPIGGVEIRDEELDFNATGGILSVQLLEEKGCLSLDIQFQNNKYSNQYIGRLADCYADILRAMMERMDSDPQARMSEIPLVSHSEQVRLLNLGRGPEMKFDTSETIVDILHRQAAVHADKPYVVCAGKSYTYGRTDKITDCIAGYLVSRGLQKEEAVGVIIGRSELIPIYSLAIIKAGGSYMPLDPSFPEDRLNYMCEDAKVRIILTEDSLCRKVFPSFSGETIDRAQLDWAFDDNASNDVSLPLIHSNDRMVILYTSGSTGKPKGVELEQLGVVNFCYWYVREMGLGCDDVVAAYANYGFDAHMNDLYPTMLAGACVHILPEDVRKDMVKLNDYFESNNVTCAFLTTQIGHQIATMFDNRSLRTLVVGGEKVPAMESPTYRFVNGYGPTECTMASTFYDVKGHFEGEFVGRALPNYELAIVDNRLNLLPEGAAGELLVAGNGVARGYLGRPDLTREKFVTFNGRKAYRTGDLVRWATDPRDGSVQIEYLGRIDNQVKLRGLRIELSEVENCISSCPGVKQACVLVREVGASPNLVCYYIQDSCNELDSEEIRKWAGKGLAGYMVPEFYIRLESFPVTANGKIDKRLLPLPKVSGRKSEYVEPKGHLEKTIAACIKELLKLEEPVSASDSFTFLGGTSLDAIKLVTLLHKEGIKCPMGQILKSASVREIALAADYSARGEFIEKKRALYPAQLRIFNEFLSRPDSLQNRKGIIMDVNIPLDEEILEKTVAQWGERHPELTSSIAYVGTDEPVQVFLEGRGIPICIEDLLNESDPLGSMQDHETQLKLGIVELQTHPLVQVLLGKVSEKENYLLVVYHTIIAEQWRIRSFLADLVGALADAAGCQSSLDDWHYILSCYERHTEECGREDWSKETPAEPVSSHTASENIEGEDNYFTYNQNGRYPGLVFVHTGNTGAEAYAPLAARLKDICPFAVIDQYNLFHQDSVLHGIPAIASKYIEVLKAHQPEGPYFLGGWCYGGMVAYEMACQLRNAGEDVPLLVMLDSFCSKNKIWERSINKPGTDDMREYFSQSPLFSDLVGRNLLDALVLNSIQVNRDMQSFRPRKYDGKVLYFKSVAEDPLRAVRDNTECNAGGFESFIRPELLKIVKVDQQHDDMMNNESLEVEVPLIIEELSSYDIDR